MSVLDHFRPFVVARNTQENEKPEEITASNGILSHMVIFSKSLLPARYLPGITGEAPGELSATEG